MQNYFKKLAKETFARTLKQWYNLVIALGGGFIPFFYLFFASKKISLFVSSIFAISVSLAIFTIIFLYNFFSFFINTALRERDTLIASLQDQLKEIQNRVILPDHLRLEDIRPYVIEENILRKEYKFNSDALSFDVYCQLYFKIKAGNSDVQYLTHRYDSAGCNHNKDAFKNMHISLREKVYQQYTFELTSSSSETEHIIKIELINRKLRKGESIEYTIELIYNNYQFISEEELRSLYYYRLYPKENEISSSLMGNIGMKRLQILVEFPRNYQYCHPDYDVTSFLVQVNQEKKRIENEFADSTPSNSSQICLTVENPVVGLNYGVLWKPPSLEILRNTGFLTEEQSEILKQKMA